EIVANQKIALAVEHRLAAGDISAAGDLQRQYPRAWRDAQIRHERNRAHGLAWGNGIKLAEQRKEPVGQVPGITRDGLSRRQRVGRRIALRRRRSDEEAVARTGRYTC